MTTPDRRAWFIRGYPIKDANDNVAAMVEVTLETTERKQAEEALRESEEKFDAMLRSIGDHMSMMDKDLNIVWANETAKKIFGNDIIGKKCYEVYHRRKEPCEPYPCLTLKAFQDGKVHEHDTQVMDKDGKIIHFHCTANVALRDKEGKPTAVIEISRDITEHKRMEEVLRASEERYRDLYKKAKLLAERDPLTKLFNHRRISELLENEIERAKRKEEVFSIMMLDVDDLKLINDAYGHVVGDKLLKNIADIFKNSCRSIDLIGRYGGDEFLIILPYTDGERAKNMAQRICEKIQKQGLKINGIKNIPTRLSIGVATYPFDSMVSRELISLADRRMYESKRSGKSVVSVSVPEVKEYLITKEPTLGVLEGLVNAVNGKDHYTRAHSELVTRFSLSLGKEVNLSHEEMEALRIASLLHDIGKIGIPESILRKPGPLEREEFELIKQHPRLGAMMLDGPPPHRDHVINAIKHHHERYDGKGYPGELKGKDIPLLARIIGIVDAYCAMITDRPYRKALTQEGAIAELKKGAGTQFDPELVDKFIKCLKDLKERKF